MSEKVWHDLPRFFAHHIDEYMQKVTTQFFELVSFKTIEIGNDKAGISSCCFCTTSSAPLPS